MYNNQEQFASPTALYQQQWFEQMIASGNPQPQVQPAATPAPVQQPQPQVEAPSSASSAASNEWMIQWFDHSKKSIWSIGTPMFKYCKKRKEHYSEQFPDIWYKAPYKYHMLLEVEGMNETDNILALAELNYEDGQPVVYNKTQSKKSKKAQKTSETPQLSSGVVSNNENYFVHSQRLKPEAATKSEVTIGPFQFNICSYKQDGRKFRMVVYLYTPSTTPTDAQASNRISLVCCLVSPPFTIRAKKPIVSPGIKKNKSSTKADQEEEEPAPTTSNKKRKPEEEAESPEPKKQRTIPAAIVVPQPISQPIIPPPQATPAPAPAVAQVSEDFFIPFDALSPSTPVKIVEKPLSGAEKVGNIVALFKSMDDKDRKELLGQLLENTYAHEKEFVRRKYFESAPETNMLLQAQQAAQQQYVQHFNMLGSVHSHHYMPHGTHVQVPAVQSNDVDQFFVDLL